MILNMIRFMIMSGNWMPGAEGITRFYEFRVTCVALSIVSIHRSKAGLSEARHKGTRDSSYMQVL